MNWKIDIMIERKELEMVEATMVDSVLPDYEDYEVKFEMREKGTTIEEVSINVRVSLGNTKGSRAERRFRAKKKASIMLDKGFDVY